MGRQPTSIECLIVALCLGCLSAQELDVNLRSTVLPYCGSDGNDAYIIISNDMLISVTAKCANGDIIFGQTSELFYLNLTYHDPVSSDQCQFNNILKDNVHSIHLLALRKDAWVEEFSVTCTFIEDSSSNSSSKSHSKSQINLIEGKIEIGAGKSFLHVTDVLGRVIEESALVKQKTVQLTMDVTPIPGAEGVQPYSCDAVGGASDQPQPILREGCGDGWLFGKDEGFFTDGSVSRSPYFKPFVLDRSDRITFKCNVTICITACNGNTCKKKPKRSRRSWDLLDGETDMYLVAPTNRKTITETSSSTEQAGSDTSQDDFYFPSMDNVMTDDTVHVNIIERQSEPTGVRGHRGDTRGIGTLGHGYSEGADTIRQLNSDDATSDSGSNMSPTAIGSVRRMDPLDAISEVNQVNNLNNIGDVIQGASSSNGMEQGQSDTTGNQQIHKSLFTVKKYVLPGATGDLVITNTYIQNQNQEVSDVITHIQEDEQVNNDNDVSVVPETFATQLTRQNDIHDDDSALTSNDTLLRDSTVSETYRGDTIFLHNPDTSTDNDSNELSNSLVSESFKGDSVVIEYPETSTDVGTRNVSTLASSNNTGNTSVSETFREETVLLENPDTSVENNMHEEVTTNTNAISLGSSSFSETVLSENTEPSTGNDFDNEATVTKSIDISTSSVSESSREETLLSANPDISSEKDIYDEVALATSNDILLTIRPVSENFEEDTVLLTNPDTSTGNDMHDEITVTNSNGSLLRNSSVSVSSEGDNDSLDNPDISTGNEMHDAGKLQNSNDDLPKSGSVSVSFNGVSVSLDNPDAPTGHKESWGQDSKGQLLSDLLLVEDEHEHIEDNLTDKIVGNDRSKFVAGVVVVSLFALFLLGICIAHFMAPVNPS